MNEAREFTVDPNLQPLLNAEYWDRHIMGDDCESPTIRPDRISLRGCSRFAKETLREHFSGGNPAFPLETLNRGTTFDPNSHNPGTVVLFDLERLYTTHRGDISEHLAVFQDQPTPLRPTSLPPNINFSEHEGIVHEGSKELGLQYSRTVRWGVVAPTRTGPNVLLHTSSSMMGRSARNGKLLLLGVMLDETAPIEIGQTEHRQAAYNAIRRTNLLRVCAYGTPEAQRKPKWSPTFLGRLATNS